MEIKSRKNGLITQVAVLFLISIVVAGVITFFSTRKLSGDTVRHQMEIVAEEAAAEVKAAVREYPAYEWLIRYWYEHADTLDIEYDAGYTQGSATEEKVRQFSNSHPGFLMKYATVRDITNLPPSMQKLYAEITYSWLITRLNEIKQSFDLNFLYAVVTDESYTTQFFLFSGLVPGEERGTVYGQIYPLGVIVSVDQSLQDAMRSARTYNAYLADAGSYVDYYSNFIIFDTKIVQIGMTFSTNDLKEEVEKQTWQGTLFTVLHEFTLAILCLGLIFFFVIGPLRTVQQNIRIYTKTKESETVRKNLNEIRTHNEISDLAADVVSLAEEIDAYTTEISTISAEKERIGTELTLATRIQLDMLPNTYPAFPDHRDFDIYAVMDPAREVGGDFYNYFMVDDDHLCIMIADVSGKGIPAALFMMASMIILENHTRMGKSPAKILTDANTSICSHNREEMFVTIWLGILELSTGILTAANAGHEYPILKQPGGAFELYKDKHGFVIGGMDGIRYKEYTIRLEPGSTLFLYSDGLPEANDPDTNLFGTDRVLTALNQTTAEAPDDVLKSVRGAVDEFVKEAEQFDDLTMLCFRYYGPDGKPS